MSRHGKNILKNTKNKTAPLETIGLTSRRPEHPTADEAEEKNTKNNFMKMVEAPKEEMKCSLKEMEDKNWKRSTNTLKKIKKKQSIAYKFQDVIHFSH